MTTLILRAHPDAESYGHALADAYLRGLRRRGAADDVRDIHLGDEDFDPVLRHGYRERMAPAPFIERSQADLALADHLVIITPIWWTTFPAVLHGWFERVLTPGFAYRMSGPRPEQLLRGKTATLIATSWAPGPYTRLIPNSPARLLRTHILGICGITLKQTYVLGSMDGPRDTLNRRSRFLEKIEGLA